MLFGKIRYDYEEMNHLVHVFLWPMHSLISITILYIIEIFLLTSLSFIKFFYM